MGLLLGALDLAWQVYGLRLVDQDNVRISRALEKGVDPKCRNVDRYYDVECRNQPRTRAVHPFDQQRQRERERDKQSHTDINRRGLRHSA